MKPQIMWAWLNSGGHVISTHHKRRWAVAACVESLPPQIWGRHHDNRTILWRICRERGHKVVKVEVKEHTVSQGAFSEYGS